MRLVRYYENALRHNLTAHDKIEFEIVFTTYDFGTEEKTRCLLDYGFTEEERRRLTDSLRRMTEQAVLRFDGILKEDQRALEELEAVRKEEEKLLSGKKATIHRILTAVGRLLKSLQHYGTPQFARQARMAFMARAFLKSLTEYGPGGKGCRTPESAGFLQGKQYFG